VLVKGGRERERGRERGGSEEGARRERGRRTFSVIGKLMNGCPLASKNSLHLAFPPFFMRSICFSVHLSIVRLRTNDRCDPRLRCVPLHARQSETPSESEHHCGWGVAHSTQVLLAPLRAGEEGEEGEGARGRGGGGARWGESQPLALDRTSPARAHTACAHVRGARKSWNRGSLLHPLRARASQRG